MTASRASQRGFALLLGTVFAGAMLVTLKSACDSSDSSDAEGTQASEREEPPRPVKVLALTCDLSEGWLVSHDLYLNNTSGEDLTEVNLTIQFIGEDHSPV